MTSSNSLPHPTSTIADKQCCGRFHRELSSDEEQAQDDSGSVSSSGSSVEGETFALEDGARWAQHARLNQARSPFIPGWCSGVRQCGVLEGCVLCLRAVAAGEWGGAARGGRGAGGRREVERLHGEGCAQPTPASPCSRLDVISSAVRWHGRASRPCLKRSLTAGRALLMARLSEGITWPLGTHVFVAMSGLGELESAIANLSVGPTAA